MYQRFEAIGRIGKVETRYTKDGDPVVNLSLATSESYKDKQGDKQENTEWHSLVIFKKLAEIAEKYCEKGQLIFVAGKLRTRKWEDKEGNNRYTTEIVVSELRMLSKSSKSGADDENQHPAEPDDLDDQIPF